MAKAVSSETIHCEEKDKDVVIVIYDDGSSSCNSASGPGCRQCPNND